MDQKLTNLSPGLKATQAKIDNLSIEIAKAVRAAEKHDAFVNAGGRTSTITVSVAGPRGGVAASFETSVPVEYEEIFSTVMRMLHGRVNDQYEKVKKLKEEL